MSEYKISACYFPGHGEVELSLERISDGKSVFLTFPVSPEKGKQLVEVIWPCVYYSATKVTQEGGTNEMG